jgi:hypothetical protein
MNIQNKNVSTLWPITLIGFLVSLALVILSALISPLLNDNVIVSTLSISSGIFLVNCAFVNIFFCFSTLSVFWEKLTFKQTAIHFLALLIFNLFSCYFFAKLWKKYSDVDIYSLKGKDEMDLSNPLNNPLYFFFAFFCLISIVFPLFIAGQQ